MEAFSLPEVQLNLVEGEGNWAPRTDNASNMQNRMNKDIGDENSKNMYHNAFVAKIYSHKKATAGIVKNEIKINKRLLFSENV